MVSSGWQQLRCSSLMVTSRGREGRLWRSDRYAASSSRPAFRGCRHVRGRCRVRDRGGAALSFYGAYLASVGCRSQEGAFDVGSYIAMLAAGIALVAVTVWSLAAE